MPIDRRRLSRRTFLLAGGLGLVGARAALGGRSAPAMAKSTILIWLSGGASHIDTWDMKPDAPAEYRGVFKPIATSRLASGCASICRCSARQAHHLAVVNSLGAPRPRHGRPSRRLLLQPDRPRRPTRPSASCSTAASHPDRLAVYGLRRRQQKAGRTRTCRRSSRCRRSRAPPNTRGPASSPPGSASSTIPSTSSARATGRLEFAGPALTPQGEVDARRLHGDRAALLAALDEAAATVDTTGGRATFGRQQEKAFALLSSGGRRRRSTCRASRRRSASATARRSTRMSMLLARRLVEAGVPFVTVFWKEDPKLDDLCKSGGGWDTHGNNFDCLKDRLLPEFDRPFAALLDDLHQRGPAATRRWCWSPARWAASRRIGDPRSGGNGGRGPRPLDALHVGPVGRRRHPGRPDLRRLGQDRGLSRRSPRRARGHRAHGLPRDGDRRPRPSTAKAGPSTCCPRVRRCAELILIGEGATCDAGRMVGMTAQAAIGPSTERGRRRAGQPLRDPGRSGVVESSSGRTRSGPSRSR